MKPHILFLDANVLFSAAYAEASGLVRLWKITNVALVASTYVIDEATRNLRTSDQIDRLLSLLSNVSTIEQWEHIPLPDNIALRDKDRPVLQAAIAANATHLITGDVRDFGHLFGTSVAGVFIMRPAQYLHAHDT